MPAPSLLGTAVKAALDAFPGVVEHPNGHSETLLRYVAPTGAPFAVGRTEVNGVRFWVLEDQAFHDLVLAAGLACETHVPKPRGSSGRNSNLDQIPEFKRKPLNWVRVTAPAESVSVLACLLATSSPVLIEPTPDPAPEVSPTVPPAPAPVAAAETPVSPPAGLPPAAPSPDILAPEPVSATPVALPVAAAAPLPRRGLVSRIAGRLARLVRFRR